jgi:hypothetical protein
VFLVFRRCFWSYLIGTLLKWLYYYDPTKNTFVQIPTICLVDWMLLIRKVLVDSDNDAWVGYDFRFGQGSYWQTKQLQSELHAAMFTNMTKHNSIQTILSVYESNDKTILIGTDGGGLFSYKKKTRLLPTIMIFQVSRKIGSSDNIR